MALRFGLLQLHTFLSISIHISKSYFCQTWQTRLLILRYGSAESLTILFQPWSFARRACEATRVTQWACNALWYCNSKEIRHEIWDWTGQKHSQLHLAPRVRHRPHCPPCCGYCGCIQRSCVFLHALHERWVSSYFRWYFISGPYDQDSQAMFPVSTASGLSRAIMEAIPLLIMRSLRFSILRWRVILDGTSPVKVSISSITPLTKSALLLNRLPSHLNIYVMYMPHKARRLCILLAFISFVTTMAWWR